jgi:hypothetical protein
VRVCGKQLYFELKITTYLTNMHTAAEIMKEKTTPGPASWRATPDNTNIPEPMDAAKTCEKKDFKKVIIE